MRTSTTGKMEIEEKFLKNLPDWAAFESFAHPWMTRLLWVAAYVHFIFFSQHAPWQYTFSPITIMIGPVHGGIINWFAHKYGTPISH